MINRRTFAGLALGAMALSSTALTPAYAAKGDLIGVAMPTKSSARWIDDGNNMVAQFKAAGYDTDLQYADDDIPNQLSQVENMITKGVDVLVIAAIDGTTLSNALENAKAADIKVIAGGVIPPQDYEFLRDAGVQGIYGPGSNVVECAADLLRLLGHNMPPEDLAEAAE